MSYPQVQLAKRALGLPASGSGLARKNLVWPKPSEKELAAEMVEKGWMSPMGAHYFRLTPPGLDQFRLQYGEFRFAQKPLDNF